jgi:hypothetical protein
MAYATQKYYIDTESTGVSAIYNNIVDVYSDNCTYKLTGTDTDIWQIPTSSCKYTFDNWTEPTLSSKYIVDYNQHTTGKCTININRTEWENSNIIPNIFGQGTTTQFDAFSWETWAVPVDKKALLAMKLKSNLVIAVKSRVQEIQQAPPEERVALETLREVISEAEFRKYLRYGFILVRGQSGDVFQIFRNRSHTRVWRNGKVVEEVCVRIKASDVPPTDNVIAFRQIIQTSEAEFKKLGNVYKLAA